MNNKKTLLSIIIPVYNGEKYLNQCLSSIFNVATEEILKVMEIIIIDDGSTDNSFIIYNKFKEKYSNIQIIKNSNHGVSYSRNCGIIKAIGKYIMFVDCDDLFDKNWINVINADLLSENYDIIFHSMYFIEKKSSQCDKKEILSYILTYNDKHIRISGPYSKLFNREFILNNKIKLKESLINGEDMLFNIESLLNSEGQLLIKNSYYIVRHNIFSATSKFNTKIIESEINLNEYINKIFKNTDYDYELIKNLVFINSIRTLSYRIAFLREYNDAHEIFNRIRKDKYYKEKFKEVKINKKSKSFIFYFLFKYKFYIILYYICKIKNKKNKKETFELL